MPSPVSFLSGNTAPLAVARTLAAPIPAQPPCGLSLRLSAHDLGVTQALPVEDLIARRDQARNDDDPALEHQQPNRVELLQRHVAERVISRWRELPKLTRSAFALALVGALLWGAKAECGSRPEAPAVALVVPNKPTAALERSKSIERHPSATPRDAAPLPSIDPRSTMERAAVDASAEGRYEAAIRLYDALANARPENPVYREAARILTARTQPR